jgi:zinc D-Ala-D-Ala dipeptidase
MADVAADAAELEALPRADEAAGVFACPAYRERGVPGALAEIWVRPAVVDRLADAARVLRGADRGLLVLDGWRPRSLQATLWTTYREDLARNTKLHGEALDRRAREFVTPPDRADPPPGHSTGAAVDVTLCTPAGEPLDMGGEFDELTDRSHPGYYERQPLTPEERACRDRRRMLYDAMTAARFWQLPTEWWHFEYGTSAWASALGGQTMYGEATPPAER